MDQIEALVSQDKQEAKESQRAQFIFLCERKMPDTLCGETHREGGGSGSSQGYFVTPVSESEHQRTELLLPTSPNHFGVYKKDSDTLQDFRLREGASLSGVPTASGT